jgi:hypothetical protein
MPHSTHMTLPVLQPRVEPDATAPEMPALDSEDDASPPRPQPPAPSGDAKPNVR